MRRGKGELGIIWMKGGTLKMGGRLRKRPRKSREVKREGKRERGKAKVQQLI